MTAADVFVHETAVVDPGVSIGQGTKVWHFVHLCEEATIGARCVLGQNVYVGPGVTIGDGVKIQNNVSIFAGVELGDDVFVGPSAVFTNVLAPRAHVERKESFSITKVARGATIGANATIVCGNELGAYSFVAAGSVVTHDVKEHALVVGNPARSRGWVCRCGEPLAEAARRRCGRCGERYEVVEERLCRVEES